MQYFAYGSNLCVARLEARKASPKNPRKAILFGYKLQFNKRSEIQGHISGKANIVKCENNSIVLGVVFEIKESNLEGLHDAEGFPDHYDEHKILVFEGEMQLAVTAYIACDDKIEDGLLPYDWYLNHLVNGAKYFNFPDPYIQYLYDFPSIPDPDQKRAEKENAFWP